MSPRYHRKYKDRLQTYLIVSLCLMFALLTAVVLLFPTSRMDLKVTQEVQEHHNGMLNTLMEAVCWFGYMPYSLYTVLVAAAVLFLFRLKREALFTLLTLLSGLVTYAVKILVNRPRPSDKLVHVIEQAKHQSFPSGHVLFYVVFFGFLALLMFTRKELPRSLRIIVGACSLGLIFIVPFARVYLGVHWFTDVTAGFILGLLCLWALITGYLRPFSKKEPVGTEKNS